MSPTAPDPPATALHACVRCRALPELPAGIALPKGAQRVRYGYRPATPAPIAAGGPRSRVCRFHELEKRDETRTRARATHKTSTSGLSPELQAALWAYQGGMCPSGAKVSVALPAGVSTDHDHDYAREHCDHDPDTRMCSACVTGYLSAWVNTDVVGRLTKLVGRANVSAALRRIADHLDDPPLRRLLAERPDLDHRTETAA